MNALSKYWYKKFFDSLSIRKKKGNVNRKKISGCFLAMRGLFLAPNILLQPLDFMAEVIAGNKFYLFLSWFLHINIIVVFVLNGA